MKKRTGCGWAEIHAGWARTGTGGGNHFVLGRGNPQGQSVPETFVDLLRSMIGYWLITRRYVLICFPAGAVGPTSQAPRVGEILNCSGCMPVAKISFRTDSESRRSGPLWRW